MSSTKNTAVPVCPRLLLRLLLIQVGILCIHLGDCPMRWFWFALMIMQSRHSAMLHKYVKDTLTHTLLSWLNSQLSSDR